VCLSPEHTQLHGKVLKTRANNNTTRPIPTRLHKLSFLLVNCYVKLEETALYKY
ncbi:hypothetical protein L9F63_015657, partial [Diploptera punctata]